MVRVPPRVSLRPRGVCASLEWRFPGASFFAIGGGQWDEMEEMEKTNHDFHRGSCLGRTVWASHSLGPPSCSSLINSPVDYD